MKCSPFAWLLLFAFCAAHASTAMAQVTTGGGTTGGVTNGGTTNGGTSTGTGTNTGTGATTTGGLSASDAFSGVQRGEIVGQSVALDAITGVGGAATTGAGGFGGLGGAGGGFGGLGGLGGFGGLNSLFGGGAATSQSTQPAIRTRLRSAIQVAPTSPQQVQQTVTSRFMALPPTRQINGINVMMDGRTAVVTGVVTSDRDRRMSELLMRLEPGVSRVENRVMISP